MFDGDKHDRALLALALRSALPNAEVLEASSSVEVAHHVSAGVVDALIADPVGRFGEVISVILDIRRRHPACLAWLFSGEGSLPPLRDCIGRGIDGRVAKTSSGFLDLPKILFERLRWFRELTNRLPVDSSLVFSSVFPGATCLLSDDGKLLMVSEEFERLVEEPRFALVGQVMANFWSDSDVRNEWQRRFSRAPRTWDFAGRFRCSRAEKPLMAITLKMLGSEPAGQKLWAATMADITSLVGSVRAEPVAGSGDGESEHIIFSLTHDLQAPLNSLIANAALLKSSLDYQYQSEEIVSAIQDVDGLTKRMQEMLNGIVEYSMPNVASLPREIISLDTVLEGALANLSSMIDESGATVEHEPLPALAVAVPQMTQVFQNLIGNAIKFRGDRIPRIRISAEETPEAMRIRFEDNGIGFDPADGELIFNMFHRLHSTEEYPGVGVGLAICRRIVRGHGGEIRVESSPGRGSCFILEFRSAAVRNLGLTTSSNESAG
ncbi:MAG: sensor histidine kinase [Gammaproteobacteria bacterium]